MKIKFIPLLFLLGFITAHSQMTTTNGATVVVKKSTLLYSTGDIAVKDATDKVDNYGNIKIGAEGTLVAGSGALNLKYTDPKDYGQLIIASGKVASGKANVERPLGDGGRFAYFGTPFEGYTFDQFAKDVTGNVAATMPALPCSSPTAYMACARAWASVPVFLWNRDLLRFEPADTNSGTNTFKAGDFYDIRKDKFAGVVFNGSLTFNGIPNVSRTASTPFTIAKRTITIGDKAKSAYYVSYFTYLNDPFVTLNFTATTTESAIPADYASNLIQLTNPYTSNLDLKVLTNNFANVTGISTYGTITTQAEIAKRYVSKSLTATVSGGIIAGDPYLEIIPPMTNFVIKVNQDNVQIPLNTYKTGLQTFDVIKYDPNLNTRKAYSNNETNYQVNLKLSNASTKVEYGNTYVAAGESFQTGVSEKEATNTSGNSTDIYTIPELKTGGVDPALEKIKLYINVVNTEAAKVAIPVGINLDPSEGSNFVITAELAENVIPLTKGQTNFANPSAVFYFHDKLLAKVEKIDTNFSYPVTLTESTQDRFEIFWKEAGTLGTEEIATLKDLTRIYKTDGNYKVRFDQNWKKAEVSIFSILGQLISSEKNIDTQNDYLLPINGSSSMYVIKITNEKGETVTKKIVK